MSSKISDVTVTACQGTAVSLRIVSADDQDAAIAREDFALMLLEEAADNHPDRDSPFAREVSFEDVSDEEWQQRFARGFVKAVRVTEREAGRFPSAVLHIEVTHPAWLDHVHEGDAWESYAFETGVEFADCAPILPGGKDAAMDDPGDSFILVPRAAWGDMLHTGPALLEIPAYSPSAYTTRDTIHRPKNIPADWIGRAVRVTSAVHGGTEDGSLVDEGTWARMDAHGCLSVGGGIESIARLVPNAGRRGGKLTYARVFDYVKAEFVGARQSGREIELSFRIPPDRRELDLHASCHVLDLLAWGWDEDDERTELAKALAADAERLGIDAPWDLMEQVADAYIAHYTIIYEPAEDLDDLPAHEVRTILAAEWPTATLAVTMTDEKWAALPEDDEWPEALGTRAIAAQP
ncbi:hypothetical protein [Nonomuraea helvata]|uniref:Uncharacterized protein n=1 Tax=Nonomuraea helvata TaxID=37484 RepID=A0ABV5SBY0_9ACTN